MAWGIAAHGFAPEHTRHLGASQQQQIERNFRDLACRKANDEEAALPCQRADERLGSFAADAIVDHIRAISPGQRANVGLEVRPWKEDRIVGTGSLSDHALFRR
jgi:hypothetical protein